MMTEVTVTSRVDELDADHPAALDALAELAADLSSAPQLRALERDTTIGDGKGVVTELVVGLSSAGSIGALARIVRLWLERDRHRSLTVSIVENESGKVVSIEGEHISVESLTKALQGANHLPAERASSDEDPSPPRSTG